MNSSITLNPLRARSATLPQHSADSSDAVRKRITKYLKDRGFSGVQARVDERHVHLTGVVSSDYERQVVTLAVSRLSLHREIVEQIEVVELEEARLSPMAEAWNTVLGVLSALPNSVHIGLAVAVLFVAVFASRNQFALETRPAVSPTSGKILLNGQPAEGALIVLHPRGHSLPAGLVPMATAEADGSFRFRLYRDREGVPPGKYVATIRLNQLPANRPYARNLLPQDYASPSSSPLEVVVEDQPTELPVINIASRE